MFIYGANDFKETLWFRSWGPKFLLRFVFGGEQNQGRVLFIYRKMKQFKLMKGFHMILFIWYLAYLILVADYGHRWRFYFWSMTSVLPRLRLLEFGRHTRSFWLMIGSCLSMKIPFCDFGLSGLNIFHPIFWQRSSSHLQRISTGSWNKENLNFP